MDTGITGTQGQGAITTPASPAGTTPPAAVAAPEGFVEAARFNGAMQKIQELTLANRSLTDQLAAKDQSIGSFQATMTQKETEWNAKAGEFSTQLEAVKGEKTTLAAKVALSEATALKMKIIQELKRPELYAILDVIPNETDEAALRTKIQALANYSSDLAKGREEQLMAGITRNETPVVNATPLPTTEAGWSALVNSLPLGSPERASMFDAWHKSLMTPSS